MRVLLVLSLLALAGCDSSGPIPMACTDDIRPGVLVTVLDAETGANLSSLATGTLQDDAHVEALRGNLWDGEGNGPLRLEGAYERPGTYTVTVTAEGYAPFGRANVRVRRGVCHVEPVEIDALLAPIEP